MRAGCCRLDSRVGELKVNRIDLEGSSPHFIGCWNIEQSSLCGEVIDFFEANNQKQEQGKSAGAVDLNAKNQSISRSILKTLTSRNTKHLRSI